MGLATSGMPASVAISSRSKKIAKTATSDRNPATTISPQWTSRMALMRFSKGEMLLSNTRSGFREFHFLQEERLNFNQSNRSGRPLDGFNGTIPDWVGSILAVQFSCPSMKGSRYSAHHSMGRLTCHLHY